MEEGNVSVFEPREVTAAGLEILRHRPIYHLPGLYLRKMSKK
jgi:hypothetical protein